MGTWNHWSDRWNARIFESGLLILIPVAFGIARKTGKSVFCYSIPLLAGLAIGHAFVPPTPGPLTAAGMLGVDVGQMILIGAGISIPMLIVIVFYCKYIGKKIYQIPDESGHGYVRKEFKQEYIKSMEEVEKLVGEK